VAGRFPLYTDADVHGPLVDALIRVGWDVLRAVGAFPEGTDDDVHFERAVQLDRVMVSNVLPQWELERVSKSYWNRARGGRGRGTPLRWVRHSRRASGHPG
jgi:hypothetical protein